MFADRTLVAGGAVLVALGWLVACDETSNGSPGSDGGTVDASSATDSGGSADSGGNDSGTSQEGGGPSYTEPAITIANIYGGTIDVCHRPKGTMTWIGPVYAAQGGIPNGAVTVKTPVPVESDFEFVTGDCTTPIFTPSTDPPASAPNIFFVVRGGDSSDARRDFYRAANHVAGKEMIYYGALGRDAFFEPSGGGTAIEIERGGPTVLEPNVTGTLRLSDGSTPDQTRAIKTGSGILLVVDAPSAPILCDEVAPPNGHLLRCDAAVRAP